MKEQNRNVSHGEILTTQAYTYTGADSVVISRARLGALGVDVSAIAEKYWALRQAPSDSQIGSYLFRYAGNEFSLSCVATTLRVVCMDTSDASESWMDTVWRNGFGKTLAKGRTPTIRILLATEQSSVPQVSFLDGDYQIHAASIDRVATAFIDRAGTRLVTPTWVGDASTATIAAGFGTGPETTGNSSSPESWYTVDPSSDPAIQPCIADAELIEMLFDVEDIGGDTRATFGTGRFTPQGLSLLRFAACMTR
jgi:hypothetical protein